MLDIKNLTKCYNGKVKALDNFTYSFSEGVYGLLGPNGSGKSTLMNIITDNLNSTSGTILYDNKSTTDMGKEFRKLIGYMPQQQGLYPNFTLNRFLYYMAALKGLSKKDAVEQIEKLIKTVNLEDVKDKPLGSFSGGMKQRVLIAQALLGNPKIIILDEPTAGLDPKERIRIRNLISEVAFNKIVIIATHVVSDIEFIAKDILLLKKGEIIASDSPHKLCEVLNNQVYEITSDISNVKNICKKFKVSNISRDEKNVYIRVISETAPDDYEYITVKPTLEDIYLHYFDEDLIYEN